MIKSQIKALRQQLDKSSSNFEAAPTVTSTYFPEPAPRRDVRVLLDMLSDSVKRSDNHPPRAFTSVADASGPSSKPENSDDRIRMLISALSESTGSVGKGNTVLSNGIYTGSGSADSLSMPGSMPWRGPPLGDGGRSKYASEMYKPLPPSP